MSNTVVTIPCEEYQRMKDKIAKLEALEYNLTDFLIEAMNKEITFIKEYRKDYSDLRFSHLSIDVLCQRIGYQSLYEEKNKELKEYFDSQSNKGL